MKTAEVADVAYEYDDGLYLNLTNRCPTACTFCVKKQWSWRYRGWDLKLSGEPSAAAVSEVAVSRLSRRPFRELVFCGYGESTYRLPELVEISRRVRREYPELPIRLNTIGLGDMIWKCDISPDLARAVDAVSVSLNTADPAQWKRLHRPAAEFREEGFAAALRFTARCAARGLHVTVTAVDLPGVDLWAVTDLALKLGAEFRVRPRLENSVPDIAP